MSSVGQRDTSPEIRLRHTLHRLGLRYRLYDRKLPGSPDLVMPRFNTVLFVHGCFWHVHKGCKFATKPSSREDFWREKFEANRKRDKKNYERLLAAGWRVLVVWECALKRKKDVDLEKLGLLVADWLKSKETYREISRSSTSLDHSPCLTVRNLC